MPTGTVKWFNNAKGFGFILPDGGGDDLFVHYTSICMEGYRTLKSGQLVAFDVEAGQKGSHAKNISVVSQAKKKPERPTHENAAKAATTADVRAPEAMSSSAEEAPKPQRSYAAEES